MPGSFIAVESNMSRTSIIRVGLTESLALGIIYVGAARYAYDSRVPGVNVAPCVLALCAYQATWNKDIMFRIKSYVETTEKQTFM